MGKFEIIAGGLLFTGAFTIPVFRSGGRTHLTCFEWVMNHTIWGAPIEYVPEEDYARELEGIELISSQIELLGGETVSYNSQELIGTTVSELTSALDVMEDSLKVGGRARLQIASEDLPDKQSLDQFYYDLVSTGFHASRPKAKIVDGVPLTELVITKGSPQWALLIPIIPVVMIVGLIAFGIMRIEAITKALMPLLLVGGGVAIAIMAAISASPRAAAIAERAVVRR